MKIDLLVILTVALCFKFSNAEQEKPEKKGKTWAVLVCGFDYYRYTYGCEAGVYRAYHVLVDGGISPDNIITLAADNAPWNKRNPLAGVVIHGEEFLHNYTKEYYLDVNIDYSDDDELNSTQFMNIFTGNSKLLKGFGTERVLNSGPDDNILFYYIGLGHTQWFTIYEDFVDITEFVPMLEKLKEQKRFKKGFPDFLACGPLQLNNIYTADPFYSSLLHITEHVFLYIADASFTGSFFDDYLDTDKNIYALTNTGRYLMFDLCHWNDQVQAYTSTCFSYALLNYIEYLVKTKKIDKESIFDLFYNVRTATSSFAATNIYGELITAGTKITEFFGDFKNVPVHENSEKLALPEKMGPSSCSGIDDLLNQLQASLETADATKLKELNKAIDNISSVVAATSNVTNAVVAKVFEGTTFNVEDAYRVDYRLNQEQSKCLKAARTAAFNYCFPKQNIVVVMEYMNVYAKMCSMNIETSKITKAMEDVCKIQSQPILLK